MPCYHPLKGFPIGLNESGKTKYKITSYGVQYLRYTPRGLECFSSPVPAKIKNSCITDFVQIPCGQCIGCRLEYSRQWANRCLLEMKYHENSYFITLTYNEAHVPLVDVYDPDSGELHQNMTLVKRDFQLWMKRLRRAYFAKTGKTIRFYGAGEYGDQYGRPHYHTIVFGLDLDDLVLAGSSGDFSYYESQFLNDTWRDSAGEQIGFVSIAKASWETAAYVARYMTKKLKGRLASFYEENKIVPEFSLMSRKPGIARQYFDDHPDLYSFDENIGEYVDHPIAVSTDKGGKVIRHIRYFDRLFEAAHPDEMESMKERRRSFAEELNSAKLAASSLSYVDLLEVEERSKKNQIKQLERRLEKHGK